MDNTKKIKKQKVKKKVVRCKICASQSTAIFTKKILHKYDVAYHQCKKCGFIQTDEPFWLSESYTNAITSLDIGLIGRNLFYAPIIEEIIYSHFNSNGRFLDFAGGYGMFTRIMRDKGFDFYHSDKHCQNLFANYFTITDLPKKNRFFDIITSFELLEHLKNPFTELNTIFSISDNFIFTTELVPKNNIENWWYIGEEHGQHISFYTEKSLKFIANKYNKVYYSGENSLHAIVDIKYDNPFRKKETKLYELIRNYTLKRKQTKLNTRLQDDYQKIKRIINEK